MIYPCIDFIQHARRDVLGRKHMCAERFSRHISDNHANLVAILSTGLYFHSYGAPFHCRSIKHFTRVCLLIFYSVCFESEHAIAVLVVLNPGKVLIHEKKGCSLRFSADFTHIRFCQCTAGSFVSSVAPRLLKQWKYALEKISVGKSLVQVNRPYGIVDVLSRLDTGKIAEEPSARGEHVVFVPLAFQQFGHSTLVLDLDVRSSFPSIDEIADILHLGEDCIIIKQQLVRVYFLVEQTVYMC